MWMSVFLALIGLYFLCIKEGFSIGKGDIMIFACALVFAVHILVIDYYSPKVDGVKMSCIQFFVCGIASLPFMFLTETPQIGNILDARMPILYAGQKRKIKKWAGIKGLCKYKRQERKNEIRNSESVRK